MTKSLLLLAVLLASQAAFANDSNIEEQLQTDDTAASTLSDVLAPSELLAAPPRDHRTPRGDLIVTAISIQKTITDDVSNSPIQMVTITVQNIGNRPVQATTDEIQMNGPHYQASVYGPNGIPNSYNLGAAIGPGQFGLMSFYLPVGTLRHCQRVSGVIDTRHTIQFGPYEQTFYNDSLATVFVVDRQAQPQRLCLDPVVHR